MPIIYLFLIEDQAYLKFVLQSRCYSSEDSLYSVQSEPYIKGVPVERTSVDVFETEYLLL